MKLEAMYGLNEEKGKQQYYDDDDDDCTQEAFINPNNKTRRKPIYNTSNASDDIIKCIGSLRIEYSDANILTNPPEISIGTGTIVKIDEQNRCYVLTVAHNVRQALRQCKICHERTIKAWCSKCEQKTSKLKPQQLIKPTSVDFIRRCIVPEKTDNNRKYTFGDAECVYDINQCFIPETLYHLWTSAMAGYDIAILIFKCTNNNDINMYQSICQRIQLKCDKTFGEIENKLFIYGYPFDKFKKQHNTKEYQMYGMSSGNLSGIGNQFKIETHIKSNKAYIINNEIDTQKGQSGSCIWSYDSGNRNKYTIYGVHSGGRAANIIKGRESGVNYGTFLDEENLYWIKSIENTFVIRSSLGNNTLISHFEQIKQLHQQQCNKLKAEIEKLRKELEHDTRNINLNRESSIQKESKQLKENDNNDNNDEIEYKQQVDEWDAKKKGSNISINGNSIKHSGWFDGWCSVYGKMICKGSGKYNWKLYIDHIKNNTIIIGVACGETNYLNVSADRAKGFVFHAADSNTWIKNDAKFSKKGYGQYIKESNMMDVMLDLDNNTLSFEIDEKDCGIAIENMPKDIEYRLVVSMYHKGSKVILWPPKI